MQTENKLFDDFSKFMTNAAGTLAGIGREAESATRERFKDWVGGLEFISREEFDAVKAMAAAARDDADSLRARIEALESGGSAAPRSAKAGATKAT